MILIITTTIQAKLISLPHSNTLIYPPSKLVIIRTNFSVFQEFLKVRDSTTEIKIVGDVAALLTLKANWFDTLTVKQWEIMINNDVFFPATNEETPYK